jgi:hypothetical protein
MGKFDFNCYTILINNSKKQKEALSAVMSKK